MSETTTQVSIAVPARQASGLLSTSSPGQFSASTTSPAIALPRFHSTRRLPSFKDKIQSLMSSVLSRQDSSRSTSSGARIDRMHEVMGVYKGKVLPDSVFGRYWYTIMVVVATYNYVVLTRTIAFDNTSSYGEVAMRVTCSAILFCDYYLHYRYVQGYYWFVYVDVLIAFPFGIILFFTDSVYSARVVFAALPSLKIFRLYNMFSQSAPDAVDVHYVTFYCRAMPAIFLIYVFGILLHTAVIVKVLIVPVMSYYDSLRWIWIMMCTAPYTANVIDRADLVFAGLCMTTSMLLQGYIIEGMTQAVFSFSVKDSNRREMLMTLEMVRHYGIPLELQHDILSFQFHILEDTSYRSSCATLEKLPPTMLREIQMYVKMDILNKVSFFDGASHACKLALGEVMTQRIVEPDEEIIVAGDIGDTMYFMLHGLADVILPNGLCVATLRRGDFFGEIALLSVDSRRKATVASLTYCDLLELHRSDFDNVLSEHPIFLEKIVTRRIDAMRISLHAPNSNSNSAVTLPNPLTVSSPELCSAHSDTVSNGEFDGEARLYGEESLAYPLSSSNSFSDSLDVMSTRGSGVLKLSRNLSVGSILRKASSSVGSPRTSKGSRGLTVSVDFESSASSPRSWRTMSPMLSGTDPSLRSANTGSGGVPALTTPLSTTYPASIATFNSVQNTTSILSGNSGGGGGGSGLFCPTVNSSETNGSGGTPTPPQQPVLTITTTPPPATADDLHRESPEDAYFNIQATESIMDASSALAMSQQWALAPVAEHLRQRLDWIEQVLRRVMVDQQSPSPSSPKASAGARGWDDPWPSSQGGRRRSSGSQRMASMAMSENY